MAESSKKGVLYTKTTWQTKGSESDQVGWLRTECAYSPNTLIGNWNEKRFDVSLLSQARPLPSQYNHYFESTYTQSFSKEPQKVPEALKFSRGKREISAFPAHQPVLDPPQIKQTYDSFLTSSMAAYGRGSRDAARDTSKS
ncbi:UPF0686 protein C11orf1 homolog [Geodia barretti]|uniref:UPF0686 protein C11orf1 homolog n=1 Tax=Geodia barretti TaxID=519541 RepID=A0AA35SF02_GEOBA|nr:UPF0686 protein C11orf1 homolog [Geodia barretti]